MSYLILLRFDQEHGKDSEVKFKIKKSEYQFYGENNYSGSRLVLYIK
ncbi:MAG: hypothetical protein ACI90V_000209 [Bacillariaceae sp.]|jgi:hypothetical protein